MYILVGLADCLICTESSDSSLMADAYIFYMMGTMKSPLEGYISVSANVMVHCLAWHSQWTAPLDLHDPWVLVVSPAGSGAYWYTPWLIYIYVTYISSPPILDRRFISDGFRHQIFASIYGIPSSIWCLGGPGSKSFSYSNLLISPEISDTRIVWQSLSSSCSIKKNICIEPT